MDFKPILRFAVVSDIHYKDEPSPERERMALAISEAYSFAEKNADYDRLDALYVVGDFATRGSEIQMQAFKKTLDEGLKPETKAVLSLASHEFMCEGGVPAAVERFERIFDMKPDTHIVINGYHFISVTPSKGCSFDDDKCCWVSAELKKAAAAAPKRPIFFFQHPHITDTVYGSINWGEDELTAILMDYPQIIDFSGHSHAPINDPRSINQRHFTCLGTGSLSYFELDEFDFLDGTIDSAKGPAAQMYFVEADAEGRIRIYPYDLVTSKLFCEPYSIDSAWEPSTYSYTDDRCKAEKPSSFPQGAKAEVSEIGAASAVVSFPQAYSEGERIDGYKITVRRVSDGAIVKQIRCTSRYFLYEMPETISQKIDGLDPKTYYSLVITATGFWRTCSENFLTAEFVTR